MADNDEDLVSEVRIEGTEDALAKLKAYGDQGAASFNKLSDAAAAANIKFRKDAEALINSSKRASVALANIGKVDATKGVEETAASLDKLTKASHRLGSDIRTSIRPLGQFARRVAAITAVAAAAAAGVLKLASSVAKQTQTQSDALAKQTQAQIEANNAQLQATTGAINYEASQRSLSRQLATGAIDYAAYSKSIQKLAQDYNEQRRTAELVADAQEDVRLENERLTKSLADRKAYNALIDTYGGPLLSSLVALGNTVNATAADFKQAFGPSVAALLDTVTNALRNNAGEISAFFDEAGAKIEALVTNYGPQLTKAFENIGAGAASVFSGLLDAAPSILNFFNNTLVPAVQSVVKVFRDIADTINSIFGTNITAGFVVFLAGLLILTRGLRAFFAAARLAADAVNVILLAVKLFDTNAVGIIATIGRLVASFNPWILVIGLLIAALTALYFAIDWEALGQRAVAAGQAVITGWQAVEDFLSSVWNAIVAGATATWTAIVAGFNAVVLFFQVIGTTLGQLFASIWNGLVAAASAAAAGILEAYQAVIDFFTELGNTLSELFATAWATVTAAAQSVADAVVGIWNAVVEFFSGIVDSIGTYFTNLGTRIVNAFNSAIDRIKSLFSDLLNTAVSFLQPIIDMLNTISSLVAGSGLVGGGAVAAAGGGHIRGPGTSTSDSIPAWLSNNEYVIRAKAVQKYGVAFLNAVNAGRFNMPKFAFGGLMSPRAIPSFKFAEGGLAQSSPSSVLNLTLDGQSFEGLIMPEDVADRLTKFAVSRQVRSAGRKPSWIGGSK